MLSRDGFKKPFFVCNYATGYHAAPCQVKASLQPTAGGFDVLADLLAECIDARELLFAPQARDEAQGQATPVEIACEIHQIRLDRECRFAERGPHSDADDAWAECAVDVGPAGADTSAN